MHILFCVNNIKFGTKCFVKVEQFVLPFIHLVENAANGIFHICGEECLTIAEIAFQVADYMKLDCSLVHPATTEEMQEATPRPCFSGMSIAKARTILGYQPRKLKDILMEWKH